MNMHTEKKQQLQLPEDISLIWKEVPLYMRFFSESCISPVFHPGLLTWVWPGFHLGWRALETC